MGGTKPKSKNENEVPTSSSVSPQWIELPVDVTANILQRLGAKGILESAEKVCTTWWRVCQDPSMWRVIHIKRNPDMCRRAVDLSQGQLVDLTIEIYIDNDILNYIIDRTSYLKHLTLQACYGLTSRCLVEAVKKLPRLEGLHLIIVEEVKPEDIVDIGSSCRILKSFTFNQHGFSKPSSKYTFEEPNRNEYALAIANSMPNLRHLCLIANSIDSDGLEAILDNCPNLESLDLRQCFDLDLPRVLHKRCCEQMQIKHFKFPLDSVSDFEFDSAPNQQDIDEYHLDPGYGSDPGYDYDEVWCDAEGYI